MSSQSLRNTKLGLLVAIGTLFLIVAMYLIGDKQNLFGDTFKISADFNNVNGLTEGNNVRFGGINVGTIESVKITSDTTIRVVMLIEKESQDFIKKNSLASVGTDGLMGNKLININSVSFPSESVQEGDVIGTLRPIETDEMIRTLNRTNEDIAVIVHNLKHITEKVNSPNTLWSILMDTVVADNVKEAIVDVKKISSTSAVIVGDLSRISKNIKAGKGTIGALLTDTVISEELKQTIVNINMISDSLAYVTGDLSLIAHKIGNGEGTLGALMMDTTFIHNLNESMESIKGGAKGFDENMEALKHTWPLKSYFKRKSKRIK